MHTRRLSPVEIAQKLAEKAGITLEQAKATLVAQAELAYEHASEGFNIPGLGVLTLAVTTERKMVLRFGPKAGQEIVVPAKRKLKFHPSRVARNRIVVGASDMPDLFAELSLLDLKFSREAKLIEPSNMLSGIGSSFKVLRDGSRAEIHVHQLPDLSLPSGRVVASDLIIGDSEPFSRTVPSGRCRVAVVLASVDPGNLEHQRVALALLRFTDAPIARWEPAAVGEEGQPTSAPFEYGVDSGKGSFCDADTYERFKEAQDHSDEFTELISSELGGNKWLHIETSRGSAAVFSSGYGDGSYPSFFGLDDKGAPVVLVTDFKILKWR
jgi:nucleoid DNA-binding protein